MHQLEILALLVRLLDHLRAIGWNPSDVANDHLRKDKVAVVIEIAVLRMVVFQRTHQHVSIEIEIQINGIVFNSDEIVSNRNQARLDFMGGALLMEC